MLMLKAGHKLEGKACQMLDEDQAVEGSMKLGREEAVGRVDVHINPNPQTQTQQRVRARMGAKTTISTTMGLRNQNRILIFHRSSILSIFLLHILIGPENSHKES